MSALKTILVGLDLGETSAAALALGGALAERHGARLCLVHASGVTDAAAQLNAEAQAEPWAAYVAERLARAEQLLDESAARVRGAGVEVSCRLVHGFADAALVAAAHQTAADLLVVGTHGRTGTDRWLLGSVAERVTRMAPCSVLVARGEGRLPARIACATDFSEMADEGLGVARALAPSGATVDVIHAFQLPIDYGLPPPPELIDKLRQTAAADGAKLVARNPGALRFAILDGHPVHAIVEWLGRGGHDLLVVGSHGRRGIRRLLIGSVAEQLARRAPCSTLVVHRPPPADDGR